MELHRRQLLLENATRTGHQVGQCHVEGTQRLLHRVFRELPEQQSMLLAEHEPQWATTLQLPKCLQQSLHFHTMQSQAMDELLESTAHDQQLPPSIGEATQ
jgi:hypothetical protein